MAALTDTPRASRSRPDAAPSLDHFVCVLDASGQVAGWGPDAERLMGYSASDMLGRPFAALFPLSSDGAPSPADIRTTLLARKTGARFPARVEIRPLSGMVPGTADAPFSCALVFDMSAASDGLSDGAAQSILPHVSEGVALFGADRGLHYCNPRFAEILGLTDMVLRPGTPLDAILASLSSLGGGTLHGGASPGQATLGQAIPDKAPLDEATANDTFPHDAPPGGVLRGGAEIQRLGRAVRLSWTGLSDGRVMLHCHDVTDLRRAESRARFLEHHDDVTGLANLQGLQTHLRTLCHTEPDGFAIFYFDLFGFKRINNTMGHAAGDDLLRVVADRVRRVMNPSDIAAHIRGNKFALVLIANLSESALLDQARHLRLVLSRPMSVLGHEVTVGVGIGIVRFPGDGTDCGTLMWNADIALQHAKDRSGDGIRFYEPAMDRLRQQRMDLERDLQRALAHHEFVLFYQPVLNVDSNRIVGVEALIRWQHPTRGLLAPGAFIPAAESMGLIYDIGIWTLDAACRQATAWPRHIVVSVNVSAAQFRHDGLIESVAGALRRSGLDACRLELEVTETAMIDDVPRAARILRRLRDMGVQIALDDFGTGYSSLSFLNSLPFTRIKIDRSFVRNLGDGSGDGAAIVRAITGLCSSLNVIATAEGVETREQFDYLRRVNCPEIQGYFISRPCPAADIQPLLDQTD
ncbi:EAL domain-containing protein [Nguyenibacter vanlangensis]|uniref:EAL domain-containing protein n=1 Tax=Nguyenibacter vanlangensis TaxID=1216886 RepID=A0ABZ3D171_9PROT